MDDIVAQSCSAARTVRAPRGNNLVCRGWNQEAALRMLMNGLDPEVAERPRDLVVFDGTRVASDWASFDAIAQSLRDLANDETLLVQSGKPVGVVRTQDWAPRVLIRNAARAGNRNETGQFHRFDDADPILFGGAGAAGWVHVGTQAILQYTYEIFAAAARKHLRGDLAGKLIVTGGLGRVGGVQPLAATMNGAAILCIEVDPERIKQWMKAGYCEVMVNSLDEALRILKNAVRKRDPASVGLIGNCAELIPQLARRGVVPDLLTDQTSAHDPARGYVPSGLTLWQAADLRRREPEEYRKRAMESIARHVEAMLALVKLGSAVFEFGNHIRQMAFEAGVRNAYDFPDFVSAYLRPLFDEGTGPIRWIALSGEPADIRRIDRLALELFRENRSFARWIRMAERHVRFQGLPARVGWLKYDERERLGSAINDLVARLELQAPVVIAREDFRPQSSALPLAELGSMSMSSDAVRDSPPLKALLNAAGGASWICIQNTGEAGIGWQHACVAVVADGSRETGIRIERALKGDPAPGPTPLADSRV